MENLFSSTKKPQKTATTKQKTNRTKKNTKKKASKNPTTTPKNPTQTKTDKKPPTTSKQQQKNPKRNSSEALERKAGALRLLQPLLKVLGYLQGRVLSLKCEKRAFYWQQVNLKFIVIIFNEEKSSQCYANHKQSKGLSCKRKTSGSVYVYIWVMH